MNNMRKKGESELLSFVLLIIVVVMVGVIIMVYANKNTKTVLESTDDLDKTLGLSQTCNEVSLKVVSCSCPEIDPVTNEGICKIAFVSDSKREIREVIANLYMYNQLLNTTKFTINLKPLSGQILENLRVIQGTHPTRVELHPTKVIFNKEVNCGSKLSVGNCG